MDRSQSVSTPRNKRPRAERPTAARLRERPSRSPRPTAASFASWPRRASPTNARECSSTATRSPSSTTTATSSPDGLGEEGIYHDGTRFLSGLLLDLEGGRPFFLSSTVRDENDQLAVALTNPDLLDDAQCGSPSARCTFRSRGSSGTASVTSSCDQQPRTETGRDVAGSALSGRLRRHLRGPRHEAQSAGRGSAARSCRRAVGRAGYRGLDGVVRRARVAIRVRRRRGSPHRRPRWNLTLRPQQEQTLSAVDRLRALSGHAAPRAAVRRGPRARRKPISNGSPPGRATWAPRTARSTPGSTGPSPICTC